MKHLTLSLVYNTQSVILALKFLLLNPHLLNLVYGMVVCIVRPRL